MSLREIYERDIRFYYFTLLTGQSHRHFLSDKITIDIETYLWQEEYHDVDYTTPSEHKFYIKINDKHKLIYKSDLTTMSALGINDLHPLSVLYSVPLLERLRLLQSENLEEVLSIYKRCYSDTYSVSNYIDFIKSENFPNYFIFNLPYTFDNHTIVVELRTVNDSSQPKAICCWVVLYNSTMVRLATGYSEEEISSIVDVSDLEDRCWKLLIDKCEKNFEYVMRDNLLVDIRRRYLDLVISTL